MIVIPRRCLLTAAYHHNIVRSNVEVFPMQAVETVSVESFRRFTGASLHASKAYVTAGEGSLKKSLQLYFDCCGNEDMTAAQIFEVGSKTELMEEFDHAKNIMPISKDTFGKSYAIQNDTSNQESCDHISNYVKNTITIYHPSSRQKQNIKRDKCKAKHIHRRRKKSVRQEVTGTTNLSPNEPVLQSAYTTPAKKTPYQKKRPNRRKISEQTGHGNVLTPSEKRALDFREEASRLFDTHGDDLG